MHFSNIPSISLWTNIYFMNSPSLQALLYIKQSIRNAWSLPTQWMEYLQIKGYMVCPISLCCFKMTLLCWCIWSYVIYLCSIHNGAFKKCEFNSVCSVDDWIVLINKFMLKSPIIVIGQFENNMNKGSQNQIEKYHLHFRWFI
jgi:hypothetical protein